MRKLWRRLGPDFTDEWPSVKPQLLTVLDTGRAAAVDAARPYIGAVLEETNQTAPPTGLLAPAAFLSTAPDGRSLSSLYDEPVIWTRTHIKEGLTPVAALERAGHTLTALTLTVLADTRRSVYGADIIQRPAIAGYVRMLNPPSCDRCVILAGRWFRWNEGFLRHPRCDCQHIPAAENIAGDLRTDPYEYFRSLNPRQQERTFGRSEARAIREGADIFRVVNTSGARGLATAKGRIRYGTPSLMTVDDIYRVAGTRTNAIRLLEREGFITGPQNPAGNIVGQRERFQAPISQPARPGGTRDRVLRARDTGVRDPLDRATMTSAERRLFDANYRLEYARRNGTIPRSIGPNSADVSSGTGGRTATAADLERLERELQQQLAGIRPNQTSMLRLVDELGLDRDGYSAIAFDRIDARLRAHFTAATGARL